MERLRISRLNASGLILMMAVAILPFQNFAINIKTSAFDLTAFILAIYIILNFFICPKKIILMLIFLISSYSTLIFIFSDTPLYRLISGFVWINLFIVACYMWYPIDKRNIFFVYKSLQFIIVLLLIHSLYSIYLNGTNYRLHGYFDEPSQFGLVMISYFFSTLITFNNKNLIYKNILIMLYLICILFIAISSKSIHIFTTSLLGVFLLCIRFNILQILKYSILFVIPVAIALSTIDGLVSHYESRIRLEATNLSVLAWMQGLDQAIQSLVDSFGFGRGYGSTGFFIYGSSSVNKLAEFDYPNLGRYDAYSTVLRLFIEVGIFTIFILYFIYKKCRCIFKELKDKIFFYDHALNKLLFLKIFGLLLIFGVLLKEQPFSRGYVLLAPIFLGLFIVDRNQFKLTCNRKNG